MQRDAWSKMQEPCILQIGNQGKRQTDRNKTCLKDVIDLEFEQSSYDTFHLDGKIFLGGLFCTSNPWFPFSL